MAHAWHMQGVYAAHAPRRAQASLRRHGLPRRRASGPPPCRVPGVKGTGMGRVGLLGLGRIERLVLGVGLG